MSSLLSPPPPDIKSDAFYLSLSFYAIPSSFVIFGSLKNTVLRYDFLAAIGLHFNDSSLRLDACSLK
jgi:hypothetical protein